MTQPLREMWMKVFARLMEGDGYLVVGSQAGYEIGERTKEQYDLGLKFEVVAEATYEDAVRQRCVMEEVTGMWLPMPPGDVRFYKARACEA